MCERARARARARVCVCVCVCVCVRVCAPVCVYTSARAQADASEFTHMNTLKITSSEVFFYQIRINHNMFAHVSQACLVLGQHLMNLTGMRAAECSSNAYNSLTCYLTPLFLNTSISRRHDETQQISSKIMHVSRIVYLRSLPSKDLNLTQFTNSVLRFSSVCS